MDDGKSDLATLEAGAQYPLPISMTVLLNNGAGGFAQPVRTPVRDGNNDIADFFFADFRNTGRRDLLLLPYPGQTGGMSYGFAPSNGDGTFGQPVWRQLPASGIWPVSFAIGDFNPSHSWSQRNPDSQRANILSP